MSLTPRPRRGPALSALALAACLASCKTIPQADSDARGGGSAPTSGRATPVATPTPTPRPRPAEPSTAPSTSTAVAPNRAAEMPQAAPVRPAPAPSPANTGAAPRPRPAPAPAPPPPRCSGDARLGTIDVEGTGVTITPSAGPALSARDGDPVCDGDSLSTDANSQASVELQEGYVQTDRSTDPRFRRQRGSGCVLVEDFKFGKMIASTRSGDKCMLLRSADVLLKAPVGAVHLERPRTPPPGQTVVTTKVLPLKGAAVQVLNPSLSTVQLSTMSRSAVQAAKVSEVTPRTEAQFSAGKVLRTQQVLVVPNQLPPAARWQQLSPKLEQKLKIQPGG